MYVQVSRHPDKGGNIKETCARTWQWAFEENTLEGGIHADQDSEYKAEIGDRDSNDVYYPQPEQMGKPTPPGIFKLPDGMDVGWQKDSDLFGNPAPLAGTPSQPHIHTSLHTRSYAPCPLYSRCYWCTRRNEFVPRRVCAQLIESI